VVNKTDISQVFALVAELAQLDGAAPISSWPGLWERGIDEQWTIVANGHPEPMRYKNIEIPPFNHLVLYNGFTAGVFTPFDGVIAAGQEANEDSLIRALKRAIEEAKKREKGTEPCLGSPSI
jgi:hypothetical protein